jgi:mono/diheme cytochrome c family protein
LVVGCLTYRTVGRAEDSKLSAAEAKKLKNPVPFTKGSIAKGRNLFIRNCTGCHGQDGKSMVDVVADATDLTEPKGYRNGSTDGEMYRSIRDGAGASMPTFKSQFPLDDDLWHLVNYIHSLWPDPRMPPSTPPDGPRPRKQEEKPK